MSCFEATITARLRKGQAELAYCRAVCRLKQRSVRVTTWAQRSLTTDTIPLLMTCWELAFKHPERHYTFVHRQNVRIIEHPDPTCQKEIYCTAGPLPQAEICTYLLQLQTWWYTLFEEDLSLKTLRMPCMAFVACFLSLRWNPEALDWQQWLQACT